MTFEDQIRDTVREAVTSAVSGLVTSPEWLTVDQVGVLLTMTRSTVYDKIRRGVIPAHRFDGRIYVSREELNQAIASSPTAAA